MKDEIERTAWMHSVYNGNLDIAGPQQISITTGAKKAILCVKISAIGSAKVELNKTVVIGTGGSAAAGTAVTPYACDQANTLTPVTVVKNGYVLGSSGQSAGTTIYTEFNNAQELTEFKFKLKESTIYGLIVTSIADNNYISVALEVEEY